MKAPRNKILFIHTGTHKTGTTALQAYLAENRGQLFDAGFSYAHPPFTFPSVGNGQYLAEKLIQNGISDDELESLIELHFNGKCSAICSSEDFTALGVSNWTRLRYVAARTKVSLLLITYVRNVNGYYRSIHNEAVKGGITTTNLESFCSENHYKFVVDSLKSMLTVFPKDAVEVLHYDSNAEALEDSFIKIFSGYQDGLMPLPRRRIVNRSLTDYEKNILATLNKHTGGQHATELSSYFLSRRPNLQQSLPLSESLGELLSLRHVGDVEWVNETFFMGVPLLQIASTPSPGDAFRGLTAEDAQAIDQDLAAWLLEKLQCAQQRSIAYVVEQLQKVDWKNAGHPDIPEKFDPFAYLLMNPDILRTGREPYEHFIACGQFEGRRIGWSG